MDALIQDYAQVLLKEHAPPCLSLYQPTHRSYPETQQDPIRFRNLLKELQISLEREHSDQDVQNLLQPLRELLDDHEFWIHGRDGLAVLRARDVFRVYRLQRSVPELAVVADTFHTKPLLRILQSVDRYQVLALDRAKIRLFEGNRDALDEVELAQGVPRTITDALGEELSDPFLTQSTHRGGAERAIFHGHGSKKDEVDVDAERFFRAIDKAIHEHHSSSSQLPLVLAALPEHQALFRRVSSNPLLADASIDADPGSLSPEELRERAWQAVEPQHRARMESVIEQFGAAKARGLGADELQPIAQAVIEGRVQTLLVDADRHIGGRIDDMGRIEIEENMTAPDVGDVLDDLGEMVLQRGGSTLVLPTDRMPTKSGAAAIYRY